MPHRSTATLLPPEAAHDLPVRLRTLVNLRWCAVLGQTAALGTASLGLGLHLPLGLCAVVIGATVVANVAALASRPANYRLSEREAISLFAFDLVQLAALLALTGGLHNPFAVLIVGPVTLAATTLSSRATVGLGAAALALASLLGGYHLPLRLRDGTVLELSPLHLVGYWAAIAIATALLAAFALRMTLETERMSRALLATQTALAREQKLHDLGGVVAAAAHELGTPLATIKLVATELAEEVAHDPDLAADAALIRSQADRCRDILLSMGRAGKDDLHMRAAPFQSVVAEAAEPHAERAAERGIAVLFDFAASDGAAGHPPEILRMPEVIHSLRNLVQNAVDFARTTVWITGRWGGDAIVLRIEDDGPGYPAEVLEHLGDPFLPSPARRDRAAYEGMGLGLFISKTLLERVGAGIVFANRRGAGGRAGGARAEVTLPRATVEAPEAPLGDNRPF